MSDAAVARESHSIASAIREAILRWYALLGGIGAWAIHLLVLASIVRLSCNAHRYEWVMHVTTVVCAVLTLAAIALSVRVVRAGAGPDAEDADTEGGRNAFLGRLGVLVGLFNLALIALEELYVVVLHSKRCG